ncbi:MAG: DNA polymerase [Chitinophagaceae bacterium]
MNEKFASQFIERAYESSTLAVDTEATLDDLRDGRGFALGLSLAFDYQGSGAVFSNYFPFRHSSSNLDQSVLSQLNKLIQEHPRIVFHNAKFDIVSLATLGITVLDNWYDTMLMAHMVNENWQQKSLDYLSKTLLGLDGKNRTEFFNAHVAAYGWAETPAELMYEYAANDTELTLPLFEYLFPMFIKQGFDDLWPTERAFMRVLIEMESRGVRLNSKLCQRELGIGELRMGEILDELGYDKLGPIALTDLFFNRLHLTKVSDTPGGKPSFNKMTMSRYEEMLALSKNPVASMVLEYRGWQKTVTSNYRPYLELVSPDGRLRPNYKQHGTVTGRLSCEKPNLQQIPRSSSKPWNGSLKQAFIPAEGYELWEADYSQLEFRITAATSKEDQLVAAFSDPERDVFSEMADELGMERHDVKTLTYTIEFGGGARRISEVFGVTHMRAKWIKENFFNTYPDIERVILIAYRYAKRNGYIPMWTGRRRHFLNAGDHHKAFNAYIQGGAFEIVKRQMIKCYEEVDNPAECRMLLQVHDSILWEIRSDLVDHYLPLIKKTMEDVKSPFDIPFRVEIKQWGH